MSSFRYGVRCLKAFPASTTKQWPALASSRCTQFPRPVIGRPFTTTPRRQDDDLLAMLQETGLEEGETTRLRARAVPLTPSYFTGKHHFYDNFIRAQELLRTYGRLPTLAKGLAPQASWISERQYRLRFSENVKSKDYDTCLRIVKRLHRIHPDLMPDEVREGIKPFLRSISVTINAPRPLAVDKFGRSHGVGRRKTSTARAWLIDGTGEVLVNGKPLTEIFSRVHDRESALWGLKVTERLDKYNVWAMVSGGGNTGQAEALAMAIAKALIVQEPPLRTILRKAGCITRDSRMVERKKTGHLKARKSPAWVKR